MLRGHAVVLGGSGIVGRSICRQAVEMGMSVTSISKEGFPPTRAGVDESPGRTEWMFHVNWRRCDLTSPLDVIQMASELGKVDVVFHSVGMFRKPKTLTSRWPLSSVRKLLNPNDVFEENDHKASLRQTSVSTAYGALCIAKVSDARKIVYISADKALGRATPRVDDEYLPSKESAEEIFRRAQENNFLRTSGWPISISTLRPRFLYSPELPFSTVTAAVMHHMGNAGFIDKATSPYYGALHVDEVATAALSTFRLNNSQYQYLDYQQIKECADTPTM